MKKILPFLFLGLFAFLCCERLYSQTEDDVLDNISELELSESNAEKLLEVMETAYDNTKHKFNVNNLSQEQMAVLGLNNFQSFCLEEYIRRSGQLFSLNELKFISGFDSLTILKIKPYLYVEKVEYLPPLRLDSIFINAKQSIRFTYSQQLQQPYGFTRKDGKGFEGNNFSSNLRYVFRYYDRLLFTITADKDYGEPCFKKNKIYGYDKYNISLTLRKLSPYLQQLTIGDYRLNFATGLAMSQTFNIGYLSYGYSVNNFVSRITNFSSTSEYNYNRGIATKWTVKNLDIFAFGAYTPIDYNGKTIQQTGYHRTEKEIICKDSSAVALAGTSFQYRNRGWNIGGTFFYYHYKDSIFKGNSAYQVNNFNGKDNSIMSLNLSYRYKKLLAFSEIARSKNNAYSEILGLQFNIKYHSLVALVFRNYSSKYQNFYADALGSSENNRNERGLYLDFSNYVSDQLSFFIGADIYYHPFIAYRANRPSWGEKFKVQVNYKPDYDKEINLYLRLNNKQYNDTNQITNQIYPFNNYVFQTQLRYKYDINDYLSANWRLGYSHSFTNDSKAMQGYFAYCELVGKNQNKPLSFAIRMTYALVDDYDNRFYLYERALPLTYTNTMIYHQSERVYALVGYKFSSKLQLHLKYSFIKYNDIDTISSGNTLLNQDYQHYVSGQLYYQL